MLTTGLIECGPCSAGPTTGKSLECRIAPTQGALCTRDRYFRSAIQMVTSVLDFISTSAKNSQPPLFILKLTEQIHYETSVSFGY
ncbi:MAG: hypothetical protein ACI9DC_000987 [Gammaproteobacteria bacterium]